MVEANGLSTDEVEMEQDRVAGEGDGGCTATEEEEIVVERSIVFSEDRATTANVNLEPIEEMEPGSECERRFLVRHSSNHCRNEGGDIYARMFPHLFPCGRGHPGEDRMPYVSLKACISHYCTLSSRRFAEDPLFGLVAFDRLSVQNMFLQSALKCKLRPDIFEGYDKITPDQLNKALRDNEGRVQGRLPPSVEHTTDAQRFLKSVELTAGSSWGSDNERKSYQKDAFAYQARYGQPALFVTLTPNVATSFAMVHYSGVGDGDSIFDWTKERLPSRTQLRKVSLKNDVASALLFMRHMDVFIKYVLGGSDNSAESNCGGGLFGPVKAYFGMVETQGGGTLHGHFLVWLNGCYSNSSGFEKALAREDEDKPLERSIEAYADSIVSTDLALSVDRYICATCGSSYENLEGLPIPAEAKTNSWLRPSIHEQDAIKEPLLVKCRVCSTAMSSQHIMKQVLVKSAQKFGRLRWHR